MKPYFDNGVAKLYHGDCRAMPQEDGSVHCVVTSPPYYALRVYANLPGSDWADGWHGCLGNEPTPDQYLTHMVECFREVWRVLRGDGVLWVNISDTRGGSGGTNHSDNQSLSKSHTRSGSKGNSHADLNLLGIPERFALAMRADGWIWRDTIIWAKKSTMPESLGSIRWEQCRVKVKDEPTRTQKLGAMGMRDHSGDNIVGAEWADCPGCAKCEANDGLVLRRGSWRCTSSFEYIYMFVKGKGYYCDGDAVRTQPTIGTIERLRYPGGSGMSFEGHAKLDKLTVPDGGANRRNVWRDISPEPYGGKHYATFPSDLPRLCIQASTSERGVCPECGAQLARVVNKPPNPSKEYNVGDDMSGGAAITGNPQTSKGLHRNGGNAQGGPTQTLGWRATCACGDLQPIPATVLDPFAGTATTLIAAQRLGRRGIGMELSLSYLEQAKKRLSGITLPLGV